MQVSGVPLAACRAMSVTRVGSGRAGAPRGNRQGATIAQPVPGMSAQLRGITTAQSVLGTLAQSRDTTTAQPVPGASDRVRARSFRQSKSIGA